MAAGFDLIQPSQMKDLLMPAFSDGDILTGVPSLPISFDQHYCTLLGSYHEGLDDDQPLKE